MEVYVLFDEEFGECKVFLDVAEAKNYFTEKDTGKWTRPEGDNSLWISTNRYIYIMRRKIIG